MKKMFNIKSIGKGNPILMQGLFMLGAVLITGFFSLDIPSYPGRRKTVIRMSKSMGNGKDGNSNKKACSYEHAFCMRFYFPK